MDLTREQKCALRKIGIYRYTDIEHDGKAYYIDEEGEKEFIIPQFGELLQTMFNNIKKAGVAEIKRCPPAKANCIIRVFQKTHQETIGMCFNVYGAECYTKMNNVWVTNTTGMDMYTFDFEQHRIRQILLPDESVYFDTDFLDCYVQIS